MKPGLYLALPATLCATMALAQADRVMPPRNPPPSASALVGGTPCDSLTGLKLANVEVTSAALVAKGAFTAPRGEGGGGNRNGFATTPSFCRVTATLRPTSDSDIKIEVWMPVEAWNGRLEAAGNAGFTHSIPYAELAQAVAAGYAGTATNTGQETDNADFSIGHPEKVKDWGWRSVHEMAVTAKAILAAHYGTGPQYSYWNSCSTGGRQGLVAAEYFPNDFDGLAVGAAANPMTRLQVGTLWSNLSLNKTPESFIPEAKWAVIHKAVLAECDALDGLKDGLIQDPRVCKFDIKSLQCKAGDGPDCLTAPQIEALAKVVSGPVDPRTGQAIYPGYPLGTAMLPGLQAAQDKPPPSGVAVVRMLYQDPNWDYHTLDFDRDVARLDKLGDNVVNAVDETRLRALFARGGKILMYHGWNDQAISPLGSIAYYEKALAANGAKAKADGSIRLFMVPGMRHCAGGDGPDNFDKMAALSAWVEHGQAPEQIVASHRTAGKVDRTRPLCPYPTVAKYKGAGSVDEAQNFICAPL